MSKKLPIAFRYEVTATSSSSEVIEKYNNWMITEHGRDLLQCKDCIEFRLLAVDKFCSRSEYLFESQQAFKEYESNDAPRLRAIGQKFFQGDEIVFVRSHSLLVAEGRSDA